MSTPTSHKNPRRWVSLQEAALRASVSEDTIRRHIATGNLPARRVGRLIRIDINDVDNRLLQPIPTMNGGGAA